MLRDYVAWFMTGERLEARLQNSDGSLSTVLVDWSGPGQAQTAAVELRFSNGMGTHPVYRIPGLTPADVERVVDEYMGADWNGVSTTDGELPVLHVDAGTMVALERSACCKLSDREARLLQQAGMACPICLADFQSSHSILCLPCGRADDASACLGHLAHLKCLRAEFRRRDACPLCRTRLPRQDDAEALAHAQRNLQYLRAEAATLPVADSGGSRMDTDAHGTAGKGRGRSRVTLEQEREKYNQRDEARRWRQARRTARAGAVTV